MYVSHIHSESSSCRPYCLGIGYLPQLGLQHSVGQLCRLQFNVWVLQRLQIAMLAYALLLRLGIVTGCCTRPGTAAGYSRVRVRVGFIQPWPYPYPQPGVGGSVAGRHVPTPREKPVNGQPKQCQTHRICRYVFLFVSYIFTNHAGSRRPTTANEGQRRSTKAHSSQRRPTKANAGQRRPTQAHEVPQQPTTANEGQQSVFFSFLILYSYYYETVPTPPLACKYEPGVGLLTTTNHPPSPPPPPPHHQHYHHHHVY